MSQIRFFFFQLSGKVYGCGLLCKSMTNLCQYSDICSQ